MSAIIEVEFHFIVCLGKHYSSQGDSKLPYE